MFTKALSRLSSTLEVPPGTISSIPNDPDFIATVKMYAVIEPILNDLIASRPPQGTASWLPTPPSEAENFRTFVTALNMEGRAGKLTLAEGMGLLTEARVAFIRAVAHIRNRYAHNVKNMHRSLFDILMEGQRNNARIMEHLTGLTVPMDPVLVKLFIYYRLADYLSAALHTLRPPPPPPDEGGILGGLFGAVPTTTEK
jgi:hypothetical protein